MPRVLVTEEIADRGLDGLRAAGCEVDVRLDLSPEDLLDAVKGADALIIRSATQVTAEVLAAGTDLIVVGRAGIGLDNVASSFSRSVSRSRPSRIHDCRRHRRRRWSRGNRRRCLRRIR